MRIKNRRAVVLASAFASPNAMATLLAKINRLLENRYLRVQMSLLCYTYVYS